MENVFNLLRSQTPPGDYRDVYWGAFAIFVSVAVVVGYCLIAVKWFFQFKLSKRAEERLALGRLRTIVICCGVLGLIFVTFNVTRFRFIWRVYDLLLLLVACYTWACAFRMKGVSLMDERLAQMKELEQSVGRYRDIAELLPYMVWTATDQGQVDYSNRRWVEYAGAGRSWLEVVHPDDLAEVRSCWEEAIRKRVAFNGEIRLRGQGECRTFLVKATPIFNGDAVKWLGACADIEDQKQLAAQKEAQARQKAFFLNALSHDLRAPLNNIAVNAHLLKQSARSAEDVETITTITENVTAAAEMLTRLLEYARAGQEENVMETISVAAMLHQVRRRFLPLAAQKGLELRVIEEEGLTCKTDRRKVDRVITNLVDNAIKYTRQGGVELAYFSAGDDRISFRVTDTGDGVPRESAPHLFDEFYQVDNHDRDQSKGFGLGLAICRALARQLGGDVRLVKTGPQGSCFEFTIRDYNAAGREHTAPVAELTSMSGP